MLNLSAAALNLRSLQKEVLRTEIEEALSGRPTKQEIRLLVQRLLDLAV